MVVLLVFRTRRVNVAKWNTEFYESGYLLKHANNTLVSALPLHN